MYQVIMIESLHKLNIFLETIFFFVFKERPIKKKSFLGFNFFVLFYLLLSLYEMNIKSIPYSLS